MASAARSARRLLRFLEENREGLSPLLILPHDYPDPDSLASAFALHVLCQERFGIVSKIRYGGIIGRMENREMANLLRLPARKLKPRDLAHHDHVALLDTQPGFKNNPFPAARRAAIIIDQHPFVKRPAADLAVIDPECGATSVILAQALLLSQIKISETLATALVYGILSDTLNLYRSRREDVIQTYLQLLPLSNLKALARIQNPPRSKRFFITLSKAVQKAVTRRRLIVSHLGAVENPDLVSQVADFLLTYKGMKRSVCTGRYQGKLYVSLRLAAPNVEAGEMLRDIFQDRGEAGGHDTIAGGSVVIGEAAGEAEWEEAERILVERLMRRLRIPAKGDFHSPFLDP